VFLAALGTEEFDVNDPEENIDEELDSEDDEAGKLKQSRRKLYQTTSASKPTFVG
jgi:hypothetical protein